MNVLSGVQQQLLILDLDAQPWQEKNERRGKMYMEVQGQGWGSSPGQLVSSQHEPDNEVLQHTLAIVFTRFYHDMTERTTSPS